MSDADLVQEREDGSGSADVPPPRQGDDEPGAVRVRPQAAQATPPPPGQPGSAPSLAPAGGGGPAAHRSAEPDRACAHVWQAQALARARLLRAQWTAATAPAEVDEQFHRLLSTVEALCGKRWTAAPLVSGAVIEQAWSDLHAAEVLLVEHLPAAELPGVLPWVLDGVRQQLSEESAQRSALRAGAQPSPSPRQVALALRTAHDASDAAHVRARSFTRMALLAGLVASLFVIALCVLGAWRPTALPLCTADGACVTSAQSRALDVLVVAVVGAGGAVLSAAAALRHICGTSTPYAVPAALAALKVPLGALTAVLGLLVLRSQPGGIDAGLDSTGGLLAWAVALGVSQELFTRAVDLRGQAVLDAVSSKTTVPAKP